MSRRGAPTARAALPALVALLLAVLIGGLALVLGASPAQALPGIPDCKNPPEPIAAGSGVSGMVDPGPGAGAPAAGTTGSGATGSGTTVAAAGGSIYAQSGYAGLRWSTYDLGCLGSVTDTGTDVDTLVGNWGLGSAIFVVSVGNGLHAKVVDPSWLAPLDDVTASVTTTVHDAIWAPWGAVTLLGVVTLLLLQSARGQLSDVVRGAAWALLVLTVLAGVVNYPLRAGQFYDAAVIGTLGDLESATVSPAGGAVAGASPTQAHGALLVDKVLYQSWLRGEFGTPDGPAATRWGQRLFDAQTLSYAEVAAAGNDSTKQAALLQSKNDAWKSLAQEIQDADPSAYAQLQGRSGGRAAAGAMALFAASTTSLFRVVADLFLAAGLVMLRILVMFFPAVATLGVMLTFAGLVRRLGNAAGAAVINVVAFGAASLLHTTIVTAALTRTAGLSWMAVVLCLLVTVILFVLCLPLLSLTAIGGSPGGGWTRSVLRGVGRTAGGYLAARRGTRDGQPAAEPAPASGSPPLVFVVPFDRARQEEQATAQESDPDGDPPPRVWVARVRASPRPDRSPDGVPAGRPALPDGTRRALPDAPRHALPDPEPPVSTVPEAARAGLPSSPRAMLPQSPGPVAAQANGSYRSARAGADGGDSAWSTSGWGGTSWGGNEWGANGWAGAGSAGSPGASADSGPVLEGRVLDRDAWWPGTVDGEQLGPHDANLTQDRLGSGRAVATLLVWDPWAAGALAEPVGSVRSGDPE